MATAHDVLSVFRIIFSNAYQSLRQYKDKTSTPYARVFMLVLGLVVVGRGSLWGYHWYIANREATAQKTFAEAMQLYDDAWDNPNTWSDVAGALSMGHEQNRGSYLAPFFPFFQAQALVQQGKQSEGIALMDTTLKGLATGSFFIPLYTTKLALMKLDMDDQAVRAEGLKLLEQQANNEDSGTRTMALFHLGYYYWNENNLEKAREIWQKFIALSQGKSPSPFISLVQEKMRQLG